MGLKAVPGQKNKGTNYLNSLDLRTMVPLEKRRR